MHELKRYFLRTLLTKNSKEHTDRYPPMALFQFDAVSRSIILNGYYEKPLLEFLENSVFPKLPGKAACLDIGSNIGNHSLFFSSHFETVHSFEPNLRVFKLLEANALLADNIKPWNFGLSDSAKEIQVRYDLANIGSASVEKEFSGNHWLQTNFSLKSLDALEEEFKFERIDFVKIDVEGHEAATIRGAQKLISQFKPVIALEVNAEEISNGRSEALNLLRDLGYDYTYEIINKHPIDRLGRPIAKLVSALSALILGRPTTKKFALKTLGKLENKRNYPLVICSHTDLCG